MREFLAFSEQGAAAHGITSQQHQALLAIRSHQGSEAISIGELAEDLLIKNHSAIGLVSRLVARDLVSRSPSSEDRRRVLLALLPSGVEILESISVRNLRQLQRTTEILTGVVKAADRLDRPEE